MSDATFGPSHFVERIARALAVDAGAHPDRWTNYIDQARAVARALTTDGYGLTRRTGGVFQELPPDMP